MMPYSYLRSKTLVHQFNLYPTIAMTLLQFCSEKSFHGFSDLARRKEITSQKSITVPSHRHRSSLHPNTHHNHSFRFRTKVQQHIKALLVCTTMVHSLGFLRFIFLHGSCSMVSVGWWWLPRRNRRYVALHSSSFSQHRLAPSCSHHGCLLACFAFLHRQLWHPLYVLLEV